MHRTLRIPEILLDIFGHYSHVVLPIQRRSRNADLAALARTCKAFQEPALDMLWEELDELSPLARCVPEACRLAEDEEVPPHFRWGGNLGPFYTFSRPLKDAEWEILQGYARRVRSMRGVGISLNEEAMRLIFSLAPFTDPLFPRLHSFYWFQAFTPLHAAVPSLTTLHLNLITLPSPPAEDFFDTFADRCPYIKNLVVYVQSPGIVDLEVSRQICRWTILRSVGCHLVALNLHAILHLSSIPTLKFLSFTLEHELIQEIHHRSILVFSNLIVLDIASRPLDSIALFLPHIRLPAVEIFHVTTSRHASRQIIQQYWAGVREACSDALTRLRLRGSDPPDDEVPPPFDGEELLWLSLEDLSPCTSFSRLRELHISIDCPVGLTDADLLQLVSPCMETLLINDDWGWQLEEGEGGITLDGLVQLLRRCPLLHHVCLAIDTRTFTEIPAGLNISFPPRDYLEISFGDSYILLEFFVGLVSVFTALGIAPRVREGTCGWELADGGDERRALWDSVLDVLSMRPFRVWQASLARYL